MSSRSLNVASAVGDQVVDEGRVPGGLGVGHGGHEELGVGSVVQLAGRDQLPQLGQGGQVALGSAVQDHRSCDPLDRLGDRFPVSSESRSAARRTWPPFLVLVAAPSPVRSVHGRYNRTVTEAPVVCPPPAHVGEDPIALEQDEREPRSGPAQAPGLRAQPLAHQRGEAGDAALDAGRAVLVGPEVARPRSPSAPPSRRPGSRWRPARRPSCRGAAARRRSGTADGGPERRRARAGVAGPTAGRTPGRRG